MSYSVHNVHAILDECCVRFGLPALKDKVRFRWSNRMTRAAGFAFNTGVIKLSIPLFARATPEKQRNIIVHEICHIAERVMGYKMGHGKLWKSLMLSMGETPTRCHNIDRSGLRRTN